MGHAKGSSEGFTAEERAAMREAARERKAASARGGKADPAQAEAEVLAKIAELDGLDRALAERIHRIVRATVPDIEPRTWYGMPAYARGGRTICFFQAASKFRVRYATLGFQPDARLDEGELWPVAYALTALTPEVEARIAELVRRAAG